MARGRLEVKDHHIGDPLRRLLPSPECVHSMNTNISRDNTLADITPPNMLICYDIVVRPVYYVNHMGVKSSQCVILSVGKMQTQNDNNYDLTRTSHRNELTCNLYALALNHIKHTHVQSHWIFN